MLVFGYSAGGTSTGLRSRFTQFSELLARTSKLEIVLFEGSSYDELTAAVIAGYVDVAWLPPILFVSLQAHGVTPLASLHRGGTSTFCSVLIVRKDSPILEPAALVGTRAAWVDTFSASGFVIPRVRLATLGIDPRVAFTEQRFCRSHESVVRMVVGGRADFGATYAGVNSNGDVTRGPWTALEGAKEAVRVLTTFDGIPGDVVAARAAIDPETRARLIQALHAISRNHRSRLLANDAFGVDAFHEFASAGYDELRSVVADAKEHGLLNLTDTFTQTDAHPTLSSATSLRRQ